MPHSPATLPDQVLALLSAAPDGLSAPELRARLQSHVSQPTLWRVLDALRAEGRVTVAGRARATRYHATSRSAPASLRSRALHRLVARRVATDPRLVERARTRLAVLARVNPHGRLYHDRWRQLLDGPLPGLLRVMTEDSEQADTLRKESPFSTFVTPTERRAVFSRIRSG